MWAFGCFARTSAAIEAQEGSRLPGARRAANRATNASSGVEVPDVLIERVKAADQGRVVVLSSLGHKFAPPEGIQFDNLSGEAGEYNANERYGISKLANGLYSLELARRFEGTTTTSNSVSILFLSNVFYPKGHRFLQVVKT